MKARILLVSTFLALAVVMTFGAAAQPAAHVLPKVEKVTVNTPVTLTDNGDSWTLDNAIIKATIPKRDGNLSSLVYHGVEILTRGKYWEQTPGGTITARVTIDPATNGGERAEVSVKGVNPGTPGGRGGGMDIETLVTLERGTSGFYTYAEYTHHADYPRDGTQQYCLPGVQSHRCTSPPTGRSGLAQNRTFRTWPPRRPACAAGRGQGSSRFRKQAPGNESQCVRSRPLPGQACFQPATEA